MSSTVFPSTLPGLLMSLDRDVDFDVTTQTTLTRKENRFTYETIPITKYKLGFEILRSDSSLANRTRELQQVLTHIARHYGQLDSFLLTDLADSSVSDHGFGVGDGSTTGFQIQRTLGGDIIDAYGEWPASTKPRTNWCVRSQEFDLWSLHGSPNNYSVKSNQDIAPDGTPTADIISTFSATFGDGFGIFIESGPRNDQFTFSVWLRAGIATSAQIFLKDQTSDTIRATTTCALTSTWQRFSVTATTIAGSGWRAEIQINAASGTISAWGAQVEFGATVTRYIPTTGSAVTVNPSYWPAFADGFEPISDLNFAAQFAIYEDGTWRGRRQLYQYARTNILPFSEAFDNAAWAKNNATISANTTTAPDGTATADTFNEGAAVIVQHYITEFTSPDEAVGELRCYSVFVKANTLPNIDFIAAGDSFVGINFNLSTGTIPGSTGIGAPLASGVITDPRWPGWFRIWFVKRAVVAATSPDKGMRIQGTADGTYNVTYSGTSRTFFAWGAMCERVSNLSGPTPYIPTPSSAAVTVTDYTLSSTGLVTLPAALASGAYLSFDGSYYRRVRFAERNLTVSQMVQAMWEAKSIALISVKP